MISDDRAALMEHHAVAYDPAFFATGEAAAQFMIENIAAMTIT